MSLKKEKRPNESKPTHQRFLADKGGKVLSVKVKLHTRGNNTQVNIQKYMDLNVL